jgi:predicted CXXCH cytochrome family protein
MKWILSLLAIAACILILGSCNPAAKEASSTQYDETNPMGANSGCYVCHIPFVREKLSKIHLQAKVGCIDCHGISAGHANDEDIGATKPDITFKHEQVDAMCLKCHHRHDISAEMTAKYKSQPICTDCHGSHRI